MIVGHIGTESRSFSTILDGDGVGAGCWLCRSLIKAMERQG